MGKKVKIDLKGIRSKIRLSPGKTFFYLYTNAKQPRFISPFRIHKDGKILETIRIVPPDIVTENELWDIENVEFIKD